MLSKRCDQNRLDRVHPVLRLLEGDLHLRYEHVLGHFHRRQTELLVNVAPHLGLQVVKRRQAMHELDPWIAECLQQSHVDLIGL